MKTVLTTLMMLPAISAGGAQHTPPPLPPQAIYILHIGESDKPLWPFVLAVKKPQAADLANMFQEPFWRHANVFVVPTQTLEDAARIMQNGFVEAPSDDPTLQAFGSFQVTLVTAQSRKHMVMTPEQSKQCFRHLLMHTDPSQATLRAYVQTLLQRLGVTSLDGG
jgi:hypothetical protein